MQNRGGEELNFSPTWCIRPTRHKLPTDDTCSNMGSVAKRCGFMSAMQLFPDFIIASPILKFKPIVRVNQVGYLLFLFGQA